MFAAIVKKVHRIQSLWFLRKNNFLIALYKRSATIIKKNIQHVSIIGDFRFTLLNSEFEYDYYWYNSELRNFQYIILIFLQVSVARY